MATVSGMTVERILEIENRISGVHTQQVNLTADLQEFSGEITYLNTTVLPQLNLDLQEANEELDTLRTVTLPGLDQSLSDLNDALENLDSTTIRNDLDALEDNLGILNTNLTNAQNDIDTLNNTTIPGINSTLNTAKSDIEAAELAVSQRTKTIIQDEQPTGLTSDDRVVWLDSNDGYRSYYWDGTDWSGYQLSGGAILPGGIVTSHMTANEISGDRITGGTIAAEKIIANSLTAGQIATGAITADEISSNAVTAVKILAGAVTTDKMTANTIEGDRIKGNTLDASKIIAESITGDRIAANAITTREMAIGDFTNHVSDPYFTNDRWSIQAGGSVTPITQMPEGMGAGNAIKFDGAIDTTEEAWSKDTFRITPQEEFRATVWVKKIGSGTAGSASMRVRFFDSTGNGFSPHFRSANLAAVNMVNGTWYPLIFEGTVPDTTVSARMDLLVIGISPTDDYYFALPRIRKKNAGELIVDGSILTNHMVANTIEGDRIKGNSLHASKIVAESITTDRMTANTINGDRIQTNTLHADKIIANTITAQKLSVRVGGNNLADNSDATATTPVPGNFGAADVTRATAFKMPGKIASWKITSTSATNSFGIGVEYIPSQSISSGPFGIKPNSVYTVTVDYYLPVDASGIKSFTFAVSGTGVVGATFFKEGPTVQGAWNTASVTFQTKASGTVAVSNWTNANPAVGKHFYVGQYMVHEGDIPQAWSPKSKELLPGTITANLIDSDAIKANHIDADALTGLKFRTAASGRRIEITTGSTHIIDFYNSAGTRTTYLEADEASSYDFKIQSGSGMIINTSGRGLTHTGGQATFNGGVYGQYVTAGPAGLTVYGSAVFSGNVSLNGVANSVVSTGIKNTLYDGPSVNCHPTNAIIGRASSSRRYKTDIRPFTDLGGRSFLDVDPIIYKSKAMVQAYEEGEVKEKPRDIPGYLAETLAEDFPELVFYDDEGRPDSLRYDRMTAYMSIEVRALRAQLQEIVRYHQVEIDQLKEELKGLKEKVGNL